jgi:localization factor PodJL
MKPGIPWSVKGIEQQARTAAKQAARRSGMTIGEWLNTVILDSADGGDDLERRYRRPPYRPKPLPGGEYAEGEEVTLRLEEIADQLHTIARHESDTAVSRQASPEDEAALRAIVERLDAYEQNTSTAFGAMQERLEEVSQRLGRVCEHKLPERAEDVPGYPALEGALRDIIEHIEFSETRAHDTIRSLQERLTAVMDQAGSEGAGAVAMGQLEQRVAELAERMAVSTSANPADLGEAHEVEQRLRGLVEEARNASRSIDLSRLQGEIDSLNQRFDDMKVEAVSERELAALRLEIEQLAATVSQASGHGLSDLERRLEALSERFEERDAASSADPQFDEFNARVQHLEAELKNRSSQRDPDSESQLLALSERLTATEQRLEHLSTIERSVTQLKRSLGSSGSASAETDDSGHSADGSPELKALEEGLQAVRASAELSDRHTQETLKAVHETLEKIITKLVELEARDGNGGVETTEELAHKSDEQPAGDASTSVDAEIARAPSPKAEELASEPVDEAKDVVASASGEVHFDFTADQPSEAAGSASPEATQFDTSVGAGNDAYGPSQPAAAPVREDYIAAARRAAMMAATRNQNPVTSSFNKVSQRLAGGGSRPCKPADEGQQRRGSGSPLPEGRKTKLDEAPQAASNKKARRKRLILAGLVLLAAVSAYGAHRHLGPIPAFDPPPPGPISGPAAGSAEAPQMARQAEPDVSGQQVDKLPAEIGPPSLRQAALDGDANAQFVVASRYLEGKVVPRDEEQAAQWYRRAAIQGLASAQYRLGSMYEHGRGMPLDREAAQVWYEQAAGRGNIMAMHNLAVLYSNADSGRPHYELAANWFRKAAERGLKESQFNLAVLSEQGLGVPQSQQEAVFWYALAAAQGDREAASKAKALEASLAPEGAKQVHGRLIVWRPLPADHTANSVPVGESSGKS